MDRNFSLILFVQPIAVDGFKVTAAIFELIGFVVLFLVLAEVSEQFFLSSVGWESDAPPAVKPSQSF